VAPSNPPYALAYVDLKNARPWLATARNFLGVVGYGTPRPDLLPLPIPFIAAPLAQATGGPMLEFWTSSSPTTACQAGPVIGACSDKAAFGAITVQDSAPLEDSVEAAYHHIFDFLDTTGCTAPLRFWNYLTSITEDDTGLERYMRFNTGRHRAFTARLRQPVPPAASAVGGHHGSSVIYVLAARDAARPIENPRQLSAYHYPPIYGPSSPSFSRAGLAGQGALFISGTASITGHETRHVGDLAAQLAETAENLRALITAAGPPTGGEWGAKIYLKNPADQAMVTPVIDDLFGPESQRLYLRGDICRRDLLIEIEAFRQASG